MKNNAKITIIIIVLIITLIILGNSTVIIKENEYGLIKKFSKVERIYDKANIYFKIPFIESVETLPKQIVLYDLPVSDVLTKDKKAMVVDNYVLWKIVDPLKFVKTLNTIAEAERRLDTEVYNALKNSIGQLTQTEVIEGRDGALDKQISDIVAPSLEVYGIKIVKNQTKRLDLPSDNKSSVYTRMISERSQIAAGYLAEGNEEAQKIRNSTDREISAIISNSNATAAEIIAQGESEYMKILAEAYSGKERSEFYEYIRSLDAIKISLKGKNKTLFLPIDSPLTKILLGE